MRPRRFAIRSQVILGTALALSSNASYAQQGDCSASAHELADRGVREIEAQRPGEATALLETAYFCNQDPGILYNLAIAYDFASRYLEAAETYERFLRDAGSRVSDVRAAEVRRRIERVRSRLGLVVLRGLPEDTRVSVEGHIRSVFANGLYVNPGVNVIEARADGRRPMRRELRVAAGARVEVDVTLDPEAATPAPEGDVMFEVVPARAQVVVDGHLIGRGDLRRRLAEGRHVIEVLAPGFRSELRAVSIERGMLHQYSFSLTPEARPAAGGSMPWWGWVIVGGTVIAATTAALLLWPPVEESARTPGPGLVVVRLP
jgi:hypothetical protein